MIELALAVIAINGIGIVLYWASNRPTTFVDLTPLPACACARPALRGSHGPDTCHIHPEAVRYL